MRESRSESGLNPRDRAASRGRGRKVTLKQGEDEAGSAHIAEKTDGRAAGRQENEMT